MAVTAVATVKLHLWSVRPCTITSALPCLSVKQVEGSCWRPCLLQGWLWVSGTPVPQGWSISVHQEQVLYAALVVLVDSSGYSPSFPSGAHVAMFTRKHWVPVRLSVPVRIAILVLGSKLGGQPQYRRGC